MKLKPLQKVSGIDPKREQPVLTLSLAIVVAVAIKVVGVLLIAAMLIIPAAAARPLSRTPEGMALVAAAIGCVSSVLGLRAAYLAQQARTCIYGRLGDRFLKASLA